MPLHDYTDELPETPSRRRRGTPKWLLPLLCLLTGAGLFAVMATV